LATFGVGIIVVSAVIAAIIPSSENKFQKKEDGLTATQSEDGAAATMTCSLTVNVQGFPCDVSLTDTSVNGGASEDPPASDTTNIG
jgi:hypothetical protein